MSGNRLSPLGRHPEREIRQCRSRLTARPGGCLAAGAKRVLISDAAVIHRHHQQQQPQQRQRQRCHPVSSVTRTYQMCFSGTETSIVFLSTEATFPVLLYNDSWVAVYPEINRRRRLSFFSCLSLDFVSTFALMPIIALFTQQ